MKKNSIISISILGLLLFLAALVSFPAEKGTLKVRIVDDEGIALPGVSLTLSSPVMMGTKALISNIDGEALFINLTPGIYELRSSIEGFQEKTSKQIEISLDRQTFVQIEMKMVAIEESITVTAVSPAVDATKSVIAEHVTHETVESLPIARDFIGYLQLAAGVNIVPNSQGRDTPEDPAGKGGLNYRDRGGQGIGGGKRGSRDNLYFLDGMNITGMATQTALMTFNNEVIQEQELMTSGVPAEYGGGKGVVGNIVTKSGGNRFSGSLNFYAQPKELFLPYGGKEYDVAADPTMLEGYKDNKYDTAFTLGGPMLRDRLWFFTSGQYRKDSSKFNLSKYASSIQEEVDYTEKRAGLFGKLSFELTANDSFTFLYFLDDYDVEGSRDINALKIRQPKSEYNMGVYSGYYQRVFGDNLILNFRYGHYWWSQKRGPRYEEAGVPDDLIFLPGTYPALENYNFGGYSSARDNRNTRDQFSVNAEWYRGNFRLKTGVMYTNEYDKDESYRYWGETYLSLDPDLYGITLGELVDKGVYAAVWYLELLYGALNANWDSNSEAFDFDNNGIVTEEEVRQATFLDMNKHGLKFVRDIDVRRGTNKVQALRWTGYLMSDWRMNDYFTLNAGVRVENHNYRDSEGGEILHMKTVFLPRIGLVWNIGGRGTHKLTAFYGNFSDPMPFGMIHFAGNISGKITHEQIWINDQWYTMWRFGSAEQRDCAWTPNTKDSFSREFSLTHEIDLGDGLVISSQGYYRQDRNIVEDYDLFWYVLAYEDDPIWGEYALTPEDFGYGPEGFPPRVYFFLSNLIGAKRNIYGFDFEVSKRFKNGSMIVGQYSFKRALGNSQSDGNADLQGDFIQTDPRAPWMWGPTPGTIPHKIKIFGTYRTPFGLDIGALFYWNSGMIFTESFIFIPNVFDIYLNWNPGWQFWDPAPDDFVQSGQEKTPAYYQLDLKLNYGIRLTGTAVLDLFLDIYNVTNNQTAIDVMYGRNHYTLDYEDTTEILLPMRFYVGARIRF